MLSSRRPRTQWRVCHGHPCPRGRHYTSGNAGILFRIVTPPWAGCPCSLNHRHEDVMSESQQDPAHSGRLYNTASPKGSHWITQVAPTKYRTFVFCMICIAGLLGTAVQGGPASPLFPGQLAEPGHHSAGDPARLVHCLINGAGRALRPIRTPLDSVRPWTPIVVDGASQKRCLFGRRRVDRQAEHHSMPEEADSAH
jgi:hypothetical protein